MGNSVLLRVGALACLALFSAAPSFAQAAANDGQDIKEIQKKAREYVRSQADVMPEMQVASPEALNDLSYSMKPAPFSPDTVPGLKNFIQHGGSLHYMGERSGLYGWFVIKDGQIQMVYVTPDAKTIIIGGLFSAMGDSVTTVQVSDLSRKNKIVSDVLSGAAYQEREIVAAGAVSGGAATLPGGTAIVPNEDTIEGKTMGSLLTAMPASPGERLLMDLKSSAHALAGTNEKSRIYMVVSPRCGHCKTTWRELVPSIRENKLSVALIPITSGDSTEDESRHAANLLRSKNPIEAWDKYVNGDVSLLEGNPDAVQIRSLFSNRNMVDRWNIMATPYLAYRAKNGQIKIVQGRPERMAVVLGDLIE